jgi:Replication-relaxation
VWYRYSKAPKDYYFLRHFLAVNDFRILITQACHDSPIKLLGFIPEYVGEKTAQGSVKKYIRDTVCDIANSSLTYSHTPDAVFSLEKEGSAALFFVEVDRGTEIVSDPEKGFLKCIVFYLNYWIEKKWQRYNHEFGREFKTFRTLIITTSKERLTHMREATTRLPFRESHAKRFLWGTIQTQATADWIFESIWHSLDVNDVTLYRIG